MGSVVRSQPKSESQRVTTAPMNDMPVEVVVDSGSGGMSGSKAAGSVKISDQTEA